MPESEETRNLVARLRSGDREALDPLFARHERYLRRVIELRLDRRLRRRVGVSDVVQAAQLDALQRVDDYLADDGMPFRWWLRRTAQERLRRVHRENLHAAKRDVRREVPLPDRSSLLLAGQLSTPSERLGKKEMARRVRQALAELADADREILLMRTFEDLPYEEIGYVLQIDPAAARKRHGRALLKLDDLLRGGGMKESQL